MKIELVKNNFRDDVSYKYKPFKYCCKELEVNECIVFTNEDFVDPNGEYSSDDDNLPMPRFCISNTTRIDDGGEKIEKTRNWPIRFCPFCRQKIEVKIADETDISSEYKKDSKLRDKLWKTSQETDSKSEVEKLKEKVEMLDKKLNELYKIDEWKGEYISEADYIL